MSPRSQHFHSIEPFSNNDKLTLRHAEGPFSFLNPTRAHFDHSELTSKAAGSVDALQNPVNSGNSGVRHSSSKVVPSEAGPATGVRFLWRSRDNRKGRHPLLIDKPIEGEKPSCQAPRRSSHPRVVLETVIKTLTCFPVWDISWLVAFIFTWGSVIWVINGFFSWLPIVQPSTEFNREGTYGGGITAFIGAIIFFELGSVLLVVEAVNANNAGCFGWAVEQLIDTDSRHNRGEPKFRLVADSKQCRHHHQNRRNLVGKPLKSSAAGSVSPPQNSNDVNDSLGKSIKLWQWFPSLHDLRTHYLHELGFLAGSAQLFGATVFGVAGITALPGINEYLTPQWRLNAAYWIPQVVGGCGFIASGTLYMLETQQKWWKPAPHLLGWHIAFWNLVGAFGFTLCGALGMAYNSSGAQYQAALATFWGSWAFLIGSYLQLYESLNKHPVEEA